MFPLFSSFFVKKYENERFQIEIVLTEVRFLIAQYLYIYFYFIAMLD
jgi:hypothetical protein